MSGFSADWLALREPADHRARSQALLSRLGGLFADRDEIGVVDLGCGSGSTIRAVAHVLPPRQSWRLCDYDAALLVAARAALSDWADEAGDAPGGLSLTKGGKAISVSLMHADLKTGLARALEGWPDIVTASALVDLVSAEWIEAFAGLAQTAGAAVYAAINYDGREEWSPPHPADAEMLAAFHAHQRRDKGFGPALGPDAALRLAGALAAAGYRVELAASDWTLGAKDGALIAAVAEGSARAAIETGMASEAAAQSWLESRRRAVSCRIGHIDILAAPGRQTA